MNYEDKFTERAKRVVNLAQDAANDLKHSYVGSEHILLGLIREESGIAAKTLMKYGLNDAKITKVVIDSVGQGDGGNQPNQGLTPR
ncbi:MAG: ATP-dependent Clp protease ATP-binding subunit ClpC, partial [Oscillospiraceae bacterium]|nr:ATP-dependent Clp protease ATP-binding subunit ClpC [Oscillospiraceae bacterium]